MNIPELLIGAVIGLIVAVIFQPPLERFRNYVLARAHRAWTFLRGATPAPNPELFKLADQTFLFQVIDGDGIHTYSPSTLTCVLDPEPLDLPPEVKAIRAEVERLEDAKRNANIQSQWNGPQFALKRYLIDRTVPDEEMVLRLVLQNTDYFAFQATVLSLDRPLSDGTTLRSKYLTPPPEEPIPFLAIGLGVAVVLLSSDHKLIVSRRSLKAGARPGELDVSFVEGVHHELDRASAHKGPDLYRTAIRGAKEEVGIELNRSAIHFLGFGVDLEYYQWNVIGMARLSQTAEDALSARTRGLSGKWETRTFEYVDARPDALWKFLRDEKLWATGWVALYWSLVREYGKSRVDESAQLHLH